MPPSDSAAISDPQRMRAFAHPLRIELIDVLRAAGEATATKCAEITGESVASCSFHLRMLAKYGFIEPVERAGREKPWRLKSGSQTFSADWDSPQSVQALQQIAGLVVEHEAERLRSWIARASTESQAWVEAAVMQSSALWATADEVAELNASITALIDRFETRKADPSKRPDGARLVHFFSASSAEPQTLPAPTEEQV